VNHWLGLTIESLVALLLLLTIGYCLVLNHRLKRLKTDEQAMRQMIAELVAATERAERSIAGLKLTVQESDQTLGERLRTAERLTAALEQQIGAGEKLLGGVSGVSGVAAALQAQPAPDAKAMVAAAQAFAERARSRALGRAA
jgi:hypothetical protein